MNPTLAKSIGIAGLLLLASSAALAGGLNFKMTTVTLSPSLGQESAPASFEFTNSGATKIGIADIKTSCGCTVAKADGKVYTSGQSGKIDAVLNLNGLEGNVLRTITITTDEPKDNVYQLNLEANVPVLAKLSPQFLVWQPGELQTAKTVTIARPADAKLELTNAKATSEAFTVETKTRADSIELTVTPRLDTPATTADLMADFQINGSVAVHRKVVLRVLPSASDMDPLRTKKN